MTKPEYLLVLTTLPADLDTAVAFAKTLVEEHLAACVNVSGEMHSIYAWEGVVEEEDERQVVIKTTRDRLAGLWERVRELHSYEVPEFLVIPIVDGSEAYLHWMKQATAIRVGREGASDDS